MKPKFKIGDLIKYIDKQNSIYIGLILSDFIKTPHKLYKDFGYNKVIWWSYPQKPHWSEQDRINKCTDLYRKTEILFS